MKVRLFAFALILLPIAGFSQVDSLPVDTMNYNKIMVIPFNPNYYFSDSDHDLAEYNRITQAQVAQQFRYGLDFDNKVRILSKYETKSILRDTSEQAHRDLVEIYKGISYNFESPTHGRGESVMSDLMAKFQENISTDHEAKTTEAAKKSSKLKEVDKKEVEYMNVIPHDKAMFSYLSENYGVDLFLFINQFELKTNYEECLDRVNKIFQREVSVHFSIFDSKGNQLYGDVITVYFPSNTNDIDRIIKSNFPIVSNYIKSKLPEQKSIKE
ncbi:MAG: hypothetical protein IH948_05615 [Bacteroidetes bacterium]|nr:hypothetical protein [Bacteroidota bacterium]